MQILRHKNKASAPESARSCIAQSVGSSELLSERRKKAH